MVYRLSEKYGEAELERWVEEARKAPLVEWFGGIGVGLFLGWIFWGLL